MAPRITWGLLLLSLLAGCTTSPTTSGKPAVIVKFLGDDQIAPVNSLLPTPIRVSVVNGAAVALPGVLVTWTVLSGGGATNDTTTVTDVNGESEVRWILGGKVGEQDLQASVTGTLPVTFIATATPASGSRAR